MSVRVWRTKFGELNIDHLTDLDRKTIFIIIAMLWSISLHFQKWPRQSKYEIIIFDIINESCAIKKFNLILSVLIRFFHFSLSGKRCKMKQGQYCFWSKYMFRRCIHLAFSDVFCQLFEGAKSRRQYFCQRYIFAYF